MQNKTPTNPTGAGRPRVERRTVKLKKFRPPTEKAWQEFLSLVPTDAGECFDFLLEAAKSMVK